MLLNEFKEKFIEAFHEYMVDHCNGDSGKLINLQEQFGEMAIEQYDSIDGDITEEDLNNCIEAEKERLDILEEDKEYMDFMSEMNE